MKLDDEQAKLIYDSERAHYFGLRSTSITGPYCEDLLISVLKSKFPDLGLGKGNVISNTDVEADGSVKREHRKNGGRRPQVDIVIYKKGKEHFGNETYCVVKKEDVIVCIEIKKWLNEKHVNNYSNGGAVRVKWETRYGPVPLLIVGFRIKNSKCFDKKMACTNTSFVFSNKFEKKDGFEKEPWSEMKNHIIDQLNRKGANETERIKLIEENILIKGELNRLVESIQRLVGV